MNKQALLLQPSWQQTDRHGALAVVVSVHDLCVIIDKQTGGQRQTDGQAGPSVLLKPSKPTPSGTSPSTSDTYSNKTIPTPFQAVPPTDTQAYGGGASHSNHRTKFGFLAGWLTNTSSSSAPHLPPREGFIWEMSPYCLAGLLAGLSSEFLLILS